MAKIKLGSTIKGRKTMKSALGGDTVSKLLGLRTPSYTDHKTSHKSKKSK